MAWLGGSVCRLKKSGQLCSAASIIQLHITLGLHGTNFSRLQCALYIHIYCSVYIDLLELHVIFFSEVSSKLCIKTFPYQEYFNFFTNSILVSLNDLSHLCPQCYVQEDFFIGSKLSLTSALGSLCSLCFSPPGVCRCILLCSCYF